MSNKKMLYAFYEGFIVNTKSGLHLANSISKRYKNCIVCVKAWNGNDIFIKENGTIRDSTLKEFEILRPQIQKQLDNKTILKVTV